MQDLRAAYNRHGEMAVQLDKARQQVFQLQAELVHIQQHEKISQREGRPPANGVRQEEEAALSASDTRHVAPAVVDGDALDNSGDDED